MILAPDNGPANTALGGVVVERNPRIVDEAREPLPVRHDVRGGLADRQCLERRLLRDPGLDRVEHRGCFFATQFGEPLTNALGAIVDLVELADQLEGAPSFGMIGLCFLNFLTQEDSTRRARCLDSCGRRPRAS